MTALSNPKHEIFAQELAKGKTAEDAHRIAGYKASRSGASQLKQNLNISNRVSELLVEREAIHGQATAEAIKSTALTKAWVIETLMENVAKAMQAKAMTNDEGETIGEFQYQGSVANKALELLGKEIGMFVDRSINENVNTNYVVSGEPVDNVEDWEREHAPKH
jgi:phage terminase small subunit